MTINKSTALALLLCAVSAVLYFLTFVNFDLYPLIWFCLVPVLCAIRETTPRQALLLGAVFGAITNAGGYYWVVHTIQVFGNMPIAVAVLGYVLLCIYQGLLLAFVIWLVRYGERSLNIAPVWSLAVAFPAMELVYPLLFPSYIGNSQLQFSVITQFVDITGMAGLTVLIGLVNGAVFEIVDARLRSRTIQWPRVIVPASAFLLCTIYGLVRLPQIDALSGAAEKLTVGLVQTNIGARDKASDPEEFVRQHQAMSAELVAAHPEIDLLIWPESAYNHVLLRTQSNVRFDVMRGIERPLLFGALTYGGRRDDGISQIYNSLLLADAEGNIVDTYDKIDLLTFGETYPFSSWAPFLERVFGSNWLTRGSALKHLRLGDHSFLPMICFEDVSPALVRRFWRADGPADVLVNGTNDSWYGDTIQPMEHLALAAFRSIETRRALIRSTNTGISAIVDPAGRITHRTGQWTKETLVADVPLIKNGSTTIFLRIGNVVGWLCVALTVIGFALARRGKEKSREKTHKGI
jgi:apolipoprotein N-acyltransferase